MNDTDKLIRYNQMALINAQAVKIQTLERDNGQLQVENIRLKQEVADLKFMYADRIAGSKKEVQA